MQPRKDNDALFIYKIWIARDQGRGRVSRGRHYLHCGRLDNGGTVHHIHVLSLLGIDDHLIAGARGGPNNGRSRHTHRYAPRGPRSHSARGWQSRYSARHPSSVAPIHLPAQWAHLH
ncbi:MAG: hypothetical protein MZV64_60355 [Ignavibacteriales bacterium]|nr:hypothetical protein [Ignavibacteriales bacterium]